ncbi:substrate-binding domain-containing protein [Alkaliphilus serpentinus]|uniref:Tungsten ABC transporter substrate-binding protein n=1 Tax=Alkaliphilus serpentinus TaxID=1482731 RepID=A0A833HLF2_9FIRM|nr:substrate-binding domain-containing protein [Alkaliphilus serpentinus]KAB3525735.1 tungsten ABC transporter substrate-binding protein [Alkaliphilus serpentinus]
MFSRKKAKSLLFIMLSTLLILSLAIGCTNPNDEKNEFNENPDNKEIAVENKDLILSTTTSTENSGLLDYILPVFQEETGIEVKVVAVGTGQALKMGEDGEADVLLVHAKASEEEFVANGHGVERYDVMYNDFILIGPKEDPLKVKEAAGKNITEAMKLIFENNGTFVSRGDDSGTHKKELSLWRELGIEPEGDNYISAGQGMGAVIQMTDEMKGYTLTDRATYLSMMEEIEAVIVVEGDERLFNQYGIIAVDPSKNDKINNEAANLLIEWILSEKGQKLIGEFGKDKYGQSLFIPNAK